MTIDGKYQVIDRRTGEKVGQPLSFKLAYRKADRLDLAYGAIRYGVERVKESA